MNLIIRRRQGIRELKAIGHQIQQILTHRSKTPTPFTGDKGVVFLHGILAGGVVLKHLADETERALALETGLFSYPRRPQSFEQLVNAFDHYVNQMVGPAMELVLVGHSLGGLIARGWVQRTRDPRVRGIICLATPHEGTLLSRLGIPSIRQTFMPDGKVIRNLAAFEDPRPRFRRTTIAAELDQVIIPRESAVNWPGSNTYWIEGVGHNEMLYSPALQECLRMELKSCLP